MTTNLHRMTEQELPEVLAVLATSGGTARTGESWRQDRMTALVLGGREQGGIQAVMPISQRTVAVSPGRPLSVGWLSSNQFAARMGLRRQTRETHRSWAELLPNLDALLVVRRDESSLGARWYGQTGFQDVMAIRCLYLEMEQPTEMGWSGGTPSSASRYQVEIATVGSGEKGTAGWDAARWQREMVSVYREVYAATGGAPARSENFWQPALMHHYYREHYQFQIVGLWSGGGEGRGGMLMGYAVIGWSGWHSKRPRMDILELATRQWDTSVATELLRTTCQLAWSKSVHQVRAVISAHDPYRGHLTRSGFVDRWGYVMSAKWLNAQRYLDRVGKGLPPELADLSLRITTTGEGGVPLRLEGASAAPHAPVVHLQGDARTVARLLLQRVEVAGALQGTDGTLTSPERALSAAEVARVSMAFPWTPWVFHMVDYI